ncbi:MAG: EAL domain-containing protein, partial [Pseudomonadota bacterium]
RNIHNTAESLDLTVIAEGVETGEQADMLAEIGCHVLQGYYIARPMPLEDLRVFVANYDGRISGVSSRKIS